MRILSAKFLLACIAVLSLLGQWQRFSSPIGKISGHEILLLIFIFFTVATYWKPAWIVIKNKWSLIVLSWLGWILIGTLIQAWLQNNSQLLVIGLAYWSRLALYLGFGWSLFVWAKESLQIRSLLQPTVIFWLLAQLILGLTQYLIFPDTRWLYYLGWDDHLNRAMGSLLDPGFFGLLMSAGSVLAFDKYLQTNDRRSKNLWSIVFAGFVLGVALSFSRAAYLAFIVAFLVYSFVRRQRSILLAVPLLILAIVLIPKDGGGEGQKLLRTNSAAARVEVAEIHTKAFSGLDWLIGKGWYYEGALQVHRQALGDPENEQLSSNSQAVDNSYLHVLFSTGLPGIILFTTLLISLIWKLRYSGVNLAILAGTLIHGLFSTALFYTWIWLIAGTLFVAFFVREQPSSQNKKE